MNAVYTIGHSTRSIEELLELLELHDIDLLLDVRRFPGSRRHPWFNREPLARSLEEDGIAYRHEEVLGGRRGEPDSDSTNRGWRNAGFRAYADHLERPEPRRVIDRIHREAGTKIQAVMCAEVVPWRCHRRLIADQLAARDRRVLHIVGRDQVREHELNAMARILDDGRIVYPEEEPPGDQHSLFS